MGLVGGRMSGRVQGSHGERTDSCVRALRTGFVVGHVAGVGQSSA